jgi:hypothetical protein
MKLVINCIHPDGLTPDEQVFVQLLRSNRSLAEAMVEKNLLKVDKEHLLSSGHILGWNDNVTEIILSNVKSPKSAGIEDWIDRYREVFKNKRIGSMGSKKACVEKMEKFIAEYPEYSDPELIISAANRYVNSQKSSNYIYLQRADYVISKKDIDSTNSRLAAFCEEILENETKTQKFNESGRQSI